MNFTQIVEALLGAVYVDSGFDLDVAKMVYSRMCVSCLCSWVWVFFSFPTDLLTRS